MSTVEKRRARTSERVVLGGMVVTLGIAAGTWLALAHPREDPTPHSEQPTGSGEWWGFAIGHYPAEALRRHWPYPPAVETMDELVALGTRDVLLTPTWILDGVAGHAIEMDSETVDDESLRITFRAARSRGLGVVLMPYLRIARPSGATEQRGHWRGQIQPADEARFWRAYENFILHYALFAHEEGAEMLVIGSELSSLSGPEYAPRWEALARRVRRRYAGLLAFAANHDALDLTTPFAFVDVAGVSAYFPIDLTEEGTADATQDAAWTTWNEHVGTLRAFQMSVDRPLVLFELGFPSRRGGLARPWDHLAGTPVDIEEQAHGYSAATTALEYALQRQRAASDAPWLRGVFFWAWYGHGGPYDRSYSPRNKPAAAIAHRFLRNRHAATR